jgi:hypothetical protein
LCRLFKDGELLNADGSGSGVYVKLLISRRCVTCLGAAHSVIIFFSILSLLREGG